MTVSAAVEQYVQRRRALGSPFVSGEAILRALCRRHEGVLLTQMTATDFEVFVQASGSACSTQQSKFSVVKCFLADCEERGLSKPVKLSKPVRRAACRQPVIYTAAEIQTLFANIARCQRSASEMSAAAFRLTLLLLYSTGATVDEVLSLDVEDVDLTMNELTFRTGVSRRARTIPISDSLARALAARLEIGSDAGPLLRTETGKRLCPRRLLERFRRLLRLSAVGIGRTGSIPQLRDLRYTFAVRRITYWLNANADLEELLPALSAYMGYASLLKSDDFLAFVPERFRQEVQKLSPPTHDANPYSNSAFVSSC